MKVTFESRETVAHNIQMFWFQPQKPVSYQAGQFTELKLAHENTDDRGEKRWFTLSSSPSESRLAITTKFSVPSSTFKQAFSHLAPGTTIDLADPMGDFVLPKDKNIPLVFVAGGMGITPYRSMVKYLSDIREKRDIHLIYAVQHKNELAFLPLFEKYGSKLTTIVTEDPKINTEGRRLSMDWILELAGDLGGKRLYLSGPEPMIEAFVADAEKKGIPKDILVTDYFPGYKQF